MDKAFTDATIEQMVRCIDPEWGLLEATPAKGGFCAVYRVVLETNGSTREGFLKASPDGDDRGIPVDARLSAVLRAIRLDPR